MFINCPYCKALVATDPATDTPPEHCPRCAANLRKAPADTTAPIAPPATATGGFGDVEATPDPGPLLGPSADAPPAAIDAATSAPSELSSQIHRIVAGDAPIHSPLPVAGIAPISTRLKSAKAESAEPPVPAQPGTESKPAPEPAATAAESSQSPPAPASAGGTDTEPGTAADTAAGDTSTAPAPAPGGAKAPAPGATLSPDDDNAPAALGAPATVALPPAAKALPSFARNGTALRRNGFGWTMSATIAALVLMLLLQLLLADRAQLAADARWRPLVSTLCQAFGCTLPPWREPSAFAVLARDVRPHPSTPGALRVTATFRNDARWPQPWPGLRLTLSDVDGNPVAARDFSARDYLGAAPSPAQLASGQSAAIAMDIVEPGARSVAFDFQLH